MKAVSKENETVTGCCFESEVFEDCAFTDCRFIDCTVSECQLYRCTFDSCTFENCRISHIKGSYTGVNFCIFSHCCLTGINWRVFMAEVPLANPIERLTGCKLRYNTFYKMNFTRFDFTGSDITASSFTECSLPSASFKGCDLTDTEFFRCDLTKADFRSAKDYRIGVLDCKVKNARFSYPDVMSLLESLDIKIE